MASQSIHIIGPHDDTTSTSKLKYSPEDTEDKTSWPQYSIHDKIEGQELFSLEGLVIGRVCEVGG